jgi:hypothetical protein
MDEEIEIRLKGDGIEPGLVRSRELAELLEAIEDLVVAETLQAHAQIHKEDLIIGLYEMADESIGLKFKTSRASVVLPAYRSAMQAIGRQDFAALTPQTIKSLQVISGFTRRHRCFAEMRISGQAAPVATISPDTEVPLPASIHGITEIAGKVLRVGGKLPRTMIQLFDGRVVYCDVPVDLAKELGHRLYSTVIFHGLASWSAKTLELEEFAINRISELPQRDPSQVLEELGALVGSQFSLVTDVPAFVAGIRRSGELV